jgi:uncharacterized protein YbjT (DUF2867 family)
MRTHFSLRQRPEEHSVILVFGAAGTIGDELISILSSEGVAAIAVTRAASPGRSLPGIRWTQADLAAPSSIEGLFSGVTSMFLLTGNHPDMARLQIAAIDAAARAHVEHVVKLSALGASDHSRLPIGRAHYEAESALMASGMRWTMLRPHVFMQNLLGQARAIAHEGRIVGGSGDGRIPFIDTRDIAAVAAVALTRPGHDGQKYILTGPEALSYFDIARILSGVIGRPVEYHDFYDEARDRNTLAAHQRAGGKTAMIHDTVRRILGREPRSFAEFAKDHADIFRGSPTQHPR